jgi:phosphoribosylformylglycinamidine cyclo-ligase
MKSSQPPQQDYKSAGVDVEAGDALVDWLQADQKTPMPHQDKIVAGIGGFASLFRFDQNKYKKPCLVTCTDGVGTKVLLASQFQSFETVAQDLVAMCVNDLICTGGDPLLFLDYYATGKLDLNAAKKFLTGLRKACVESDCALVGGETAEMPGVYKPGDFDCAGFAVGVVDEDLKLGPHKVRAGDLCIGVSSSGFHSNGYSLVRKLFEADADKWAEQLLRPTHLYVKLAKDLKGLSGLRALAHITGGGIENVPRVLPEDLRWQRKDWELPELFKEAQRRSGLSHEEMLKTFNCGMGLTVVIAPEHAEAAKALIQKNNFEAFDVGQIVRSV